MNHLVVIETQKVKSYLFASPFLRETRGASVLLDYLNRKITKEILERDFAGKYEEIYLGGGSGKILFDDREEAEAFKQKLLNEYRQSTVNARVSIVIEEHERNSDFRKPEDEFVDDFPTRIRRAVFQSQQQKNLRIEGAASLGGRWIRPCTSCGYEPAIQILIEHGEHNLCLSCLKKRDEIRKLYKEIKPGNKSKLRYLKSADELTGRYTKEFIFTTLAENLYLSTADKVMLPQDFNDIGQASVPSNYMGFIYADGNQMGETVKKLGELFKSEKDAKEAYKAFSEIVDRATREAAVEAVLEEIPLIKVDDGKAAMLPAEFILAGGDDLMLAVPAHKALAIAMRFVEKYQNKTKSLQTEYIDEKKLKKEFAKNGLTTSAGVVIAHAKYPARDLMTIAGDLMKIAKHKAASLNQESPTGTIDFIVLNESGSEPVKDRRKEYSPSGSEIKRTERPYTSEELEILIKSIKSIKEEGSVHSQLKSLYPLLFQEFAQAQFGALHVKRRLKSTGALDRSASLNALVNQLEGFPFRKRTDENGQKIWSTPLTEIIELYDFI